MQEIEITKLKKAKYNPRKISKAELASLVKSIETYGMVQPIVVNKDMTIIGGHQRVDACRHLGYKTVPTIVVDLDLDKEKELNLALNKISGKWDETILAELLNELADKNRLALTGFKHSELEKLNFKQNNTINRKLIEDFIVPPFSIFDTKQGYWQGRKKEWVNQIGYGGDGRKDDLIGGGLNKLNALKGSDLTGTSIFDPVLCEVLYTWYCNKGATIIDPFAGGHVRGVVADILGHNYIGTDVRKEQVQVNEDKAKELGLKNAKWHVDTGENLGEYVKEADLMFTCPPYYNLEVYDKDNKNDISNAESYQQFVNSYSIILKNTYTLLKPNTWGIIVVGNIRTKDGTMLNLVGDTIQIMQDAGFKFYNEIILATAIGTAPVRARKTFTEKKVVKTHQNILFFTKGKEVKINKDLGAILEKGQQAVAHHDILIFKK